MPSPPARLFSWPQGSGQNVPGLQDTGVNPPAAGERAGSARDHIVASSCLVPSPGTWGPTSLCTALVCPLLSGFMEPSIYPATAEGHLGCFQV